MDDLFVPFHLASKLKEKGFQEKGFRFYNSSQKLMLEDTGENILAPLYQQAVDWFRDLHDIHIYIKHNRANGKYHYFVEYGMGTEHGDSFPTYYLALSEGLEKAFGFVHY